MYVNELYSGKLYTLELDTSVLDWDMPALALQISALEQEVAVMAAMR